MVISEPQLSVSTKEGINGILIRKNNRKYGNETKKIVFLQPIFLIKKFYINFIERRQQHRNANEQALST